MTYKCNYWSHLPVLFIRCTFYKPLSKVSISFTFTQHLNALQLSSGMLEASLRSSSRCFNSRFAGHITMLDDSHVAGTATIFCLFFSIVMTTLNAILDRVFNQRKIYVFNSRGFLTTKTNGF